MPDRPIGMFDSGFGGLTVARATIDLLPAEDLVYIGDTGRYPYGNRDLDEVRQFAMEIGTDLVEVHDVKLVVVACNTATAAALDDLSAALPVPVVGVIDPGVIAVGQASRSGRLGVIGTVGTIGSGAYEEAVARLAPDADVVTCACPGLVEFVERGVVSGPEIEILVRRLLAPLLDQDIDALLLGCTHYPYLGRVIGDVVGRDVVLVSSADETAFALARQLRSLGLEHTDPTRPGRQRFITSGDIRAFTELGSRLLGPELIDAEHWLPGTESPTDDGADADGEGVSGGAEPRSGQPDGQTGEHAPAVG
ncbi:MAG: glutamate racemase [Actinomycetota bacterium]